MRLRLLGAVLMATLAVSSTASAAEPDGSFEAFRARFGLQLALDFVPDDVGTRGWERAARLALLMAFDSDHSGRIDTSAELSALDCEIWELLESRLVNAHGGVVAHYALYDDARWRGSRLGLGARMRHDVAPAVRACSVAQETPVVVPARIAHPDLSVLGEAGSPGWDGAVRERLVAAYDLDHSGLIDDPDEVAAIPCETWLAFGASAPGGSALDTYGFTDGTVFLGRLVGVGASARGDVRAAAEACGVR